MPSPVHPAPLQLHAGDHQSGSEQPGEALKRPLFDLERYAGWLSKDHVSIAVRADVQKLNAALDIGSDTSLALLTLDKDLGRLPGGDIRKMLRRALGEVRAALGPGGTGAVHGERT